MTSPIARPVPERIQGLHELACDLSWSWNSRAREVFRKLDYPLWRHTNHNPVKMMRVISHDRLQEVANDPAFLALYDSAIEKLTAARSGIGTWWAKHYSGHKNLSFAYFSPEFAVHQSVPLYAGGLGVLSGDHCKEASDLGVPLVGVGFRYASGYFQQLISTDGLQVESYDRFSIDDTPLQRAHDATGQPCTIQVPLAGEIAHVAVWLLRMGRVQLYLLDTDVDENVPWVRNLSATLYDGERETRLRQEMILGIGGVRALRALGQNPAVFHLNEGHAAFVVIERIRELMESGEPLESALQTVRSNTVFTTHTPIPAGHDTFPLAMVESHLSGFWENLNVPPNLLEDLAAHDHGEGAVFNLTTLALRCSGAANAVSRIHRDVTRQIFAPMARGDEPDALAITNGIHVPTWIAPAMDGLFERYLGADWKVHHDDAGLWERVAAIPDEELWRARESLRSYFVAFIREHARRGWTESRTSAVQLAASGTLLDSNALTIGFGRRFTGYKRPDLIFHDPDRLARLVNATRRPIQIVFAGKAHPADAPGKESLQRIYGHAGDSRFAGRIAFVHDYDLHVAHLFVQGCDVWLNNPVKPLEACGTSGMKASLNGVIHLSVRDGWWAEAYNGLNGWAIEPGEDGRSDDDSDAESLYRVLEEQVVPAFYDRDKRGIPSRWVAMIKQAIRTIAPHFSARRMVKQYVEEMYVPHTGGEKAASAAPQEGR